MNDLSGSFTQIVDDSVSVYLSQRDVLSWIVYPACLDFGMQDSHKTFPVPLPTIGAGRQLRSLVGGVSLGVKDGLGDGPPGVCVCRKISEGDGASTLGWRAADK